ncbi:MAG: hypothetical protein KAY04_01620 [Burkholderiales bacterium]|nr:hypothetical protein [Burkholderiales bacterium]
MAKFLKAVRLDNSDDELYRQGGACDDDEWVTSGGFAVCNLAAGYRCEPRCHCDASFISLTRRARSTLAEVVEVDQGDLEIFKDQMTQHLLFDWKAPDYETARGVAEEEVNYTAELAAGFPAEVWITVKRSPGENGVLDEQYDQYDRLLLGSHPVG